jgi:hypothetical protein
MSAIKSNFRLWGPISLTLVIALFVAQAEAKELIGSTHKDDCLVAPNSPAPQGSQWNFRLERKTQRKCWYMLAAGKVKQKPAHPDISGVAIPLPRPRVRALSATGDIVTAPTANAVAVPAPVSSDPGTQRMETARNPEPDKNSLIQATPVPESSTPSEPTVEDVAPVRNSPAAANGAADADIAPSIQDASANPMNNAPEARIEESISAPNAAATGGSATDDAIPDASAVHASVSSESIAQNFAPTPRVSERFGTPMDDAAEQSVQEEHTPPASTETSASTATSSQADAVIGAARKVDRAGGRHNVGMPNTGQQRATPPTLQSGSQSGSNGEIGLQTLIAISLTVATGLVVVGMLARAGLLDRAARRKLIATETPDPYDDPEFYRKLREGNFA